MRTIRTIGVLVMLAVWAGPRPASAAISGLERVASGLSSPIFVTHAPGDRDRLFIVQRGSPANSTSASAAIRILDFTTGSLLATPYLTITGIDNRGEGGLLGMAFHPDYQTNGKFYVYITAGDSIADTFFSSYIREYTVSANPNVANTAFNPILTWGQPQSNHNSGWIGFSPNDGYLYISAGDGGGSDDNDAGHTDGIGNAQDITDNLLGKMLRIDVNGDDFPIDLDRNYAIPSTNPFVGVTGDDEIWAYGLRNPFRDSFDRLTGDLWMGDVGQGAREEIDFQPASSTGGENYGWRLREGTIATPTGGVGGNCPGCVDPVYDYTHASSQFGGVVVTGGYVYRGPDPSLQGQYFFADSRNTPDTADDNYWMFDPANPYGTVTNVDSLLTPDIGSVQFPVSFGEDAKGNLYIAYLISGEVYRIATNQLLAGDFDADGDVDMDDYDEWQSTFGSALANPAAERNGNGIADAADYVTWRKNLGASLHAGAGAGAVPEPITAVYLGQLIVLSAIAAMIARRRS
jgi:glucose/arabinose dehydrogenase